MLLKDKLAELENMMYYRQKIEVEKREFAKAIMPAEVKKALDDLDVEFEDKFKSIDEQIKALTDVVKDGVIAQGHSEKSDHINAVYTKPRVTYDSDQLAMLETVFPQIKNAKKVGAPSVSIRLI
jgi:hypothetical protein